MKGFIYKILNIINGKFYIGSTLRAKHIRKYEHFSALRKNIHSNKYLQNSYNKYGEKEFKFEIVEEFIFPNNYSKEYMLEYLTTREEFYINYLSANYNLRHQDNPRLKYYHSEETKIKISQSNKGKHKTPSKDWYDKIKINSQRRKGTSINMSVEWKNKISNNNIKRKGWKHSKESIEKISQRSKQVDNINRLKLLQKEQSIKRIGVKKSFEEKLKIAKSKLKNRIIEIYDLNMNFIDTAYSSHDASEKTGINRSAISNNLIGISNKTKLYIFKYKEV